ncbi:MAG: HEAT repeat domain-containing protein [Anaerolineae bacterium]|nr:HEAT repeat domain-containing protein [Anaerolineae bacterium]
MNLLSAEPDAPFEKVLESLLDDSSIIDSQVITRLSDLEGESYQKVRSLWPSIALERRLAMLEDMDSLVEENHILSFEAISKIAIQDESPQVRFIAVRSFAVYETTEMIPDILTRVDHDPDINVRTACAFTLGKFAQLGELDQLPSHTVKAVQECLFNIVNDDDEDIVRCQALESLGFFTHRDIPTIIQGAFESGDSIWQASALCAMGRSCNSQWAPQVEIMLNNPVPLLRYEAVRAAGELHLSSTKSQLLELLDDSIGEIRLAAIWALSKIGGEGINEILTALLQQPLEHDEANLIQDALDNLAVNEDYDFFGLMDFDDHIDIDEDY